MNKKYLAFVVSLFVLFSLNFGQSEKIRIDPELREKIIRLKAALKAEKENVSQGSVKKRSKVRNKASNPDYFSIGLQIGGGLLGILVLAVFSIRGLKKMQSSRFLMSKKFKNNDIEIIETSYIGKEQKMILVRILGKKLLVGISGTQMTLLKEFEDKSEPFDKNYKQEVKTQNELEQNLNDYFLKVKKRPKIINSMARG